jgi:hypothetical protein
MIFWIAYGGSGNKNGGIEKLVEVTSELEPVNRQACGVAALNDVGVAHEDEIHEAY